MSALTAIDASPSGLFIDGRWLDRARDHDVRNPADGTILTWLARASADDALAAVDAAEHALAPWSALSPRERSDILLRTFHLLRDERDRLAETIVAENGKAWADAVAEADYAIEFFRWYAEEAVRVSGDYRTSPSGVRRIVVTSQPVGVALLITPWNFPAAMVTRKVAPALAAGCTVVIKPAGETPLTALHIVDAMSRAGVPAGVVNLILPAQVGETIGAILQHPAVRKLSFTGSTEVGRLLLRQSADRVISTSMELGGNAPLIVLPSADLETAVAGTCVAKLRNGGAACTAANRIYVHRSLHDEFVARLTAEFDALTVGPGSDRGNAIGAMVSSAESSKVEDLVARALRDGARATTYRSGSGPFVPPTVLVDVQHGSEINTTEIFGPIAAVVVYDEVDDVIAMANDSEFGLAAYVFGEEGEALRIAERLEAGMVAVNRGVLSDPAAPFGGVKQSGLGREGGEEGIREFLEEKYIALPR